LFINFVLENAIRKVQENQVGLKLNGKHQFPVNVDDTNLLGDYISTMQKNADPLTELARRSV
jgi:hypothetical protein